MNADLHIHSRYSSDGEMPAGSILEMCLAAGVDVFTITDHNTAAGALEMERSLAGNPVPGVRFIPGIEIDCMFEGTDMHLLGLGIDAGSRDFEQLDRRMKELAYRAFEGMVGRIARLGFPVDRDEILTLAGEHPPVGEMIIEAMLTERNRDCELLAPYYPGGERSDMPYLNFYFDWFAQGCPAYVPIEFMPLTEAIDMVTANGGVPVVAHPGLNFRGREDAVERMLAAGARGLECFNNYHTADQARYFARTAARRGALLTIGSDYHGKVKPLIEVGSVANCDVAAEFSADIERSVESLCR